MKKRITVLIILIIIIVSIIIKITDNVSAKKDKKDDIVKIEKNDNKDTKEKIISKIKVDIKGNIANPGVYEVDDKSRVIDVITLAGGIIDNADTSSINLSKILKDEDVIIIYEKEQEVKTFNEYQESIERCNKDNNDACIDNSDKTESTTKIININEAGKEDFMTLTGIGEAKAEKIVKYRTENGNFETIEDIMNVDGIGESIFDKIKEYITI